MTLRLKGDTPTPGQPDRRYYMIDVQVLRRRVRLSSGTRDKGLAEKRQQEVVNAIRNTPDITEESLRALVRGDVVAARIGIRHAAGMTLDEAYTKALKDPDVWGSIRRPDAVKADMNVLLRVLGEDTPVRALTKDVIKDASKRMRLGEGQLPGKPQVPRSASTVKHKLAKLARLLRACLEEYNAIDVMPVITMPENADRKRRFVFDRDKEQAVLDAVLAMDKPDDRSPGWWNRVNDAHRYHKLFIVLAETGLRPSEAYGLTWDDLNFRTHTIRLWRDDELKTEGSARSLPMTQRCEEALESASCKEGKAGPFDGMNIRRGQDLWKAATKATGITHRDAVPYALRHTAGTRLLTATGDLRLVQEWLGHDDIKTTTRYAKVVDSRMRSAAAALDQLSQ